MNHFKIYTQESLIVMEWLGSVDSIEYRRVHMNFLKEMETSNYLLWLLNYQQGKGIVLEDHEWTIKEWLPKALALMKDVEKIAIVVPENIFNKVSMRILTTQLQEQNEVDMAFFRTDAEARNWLIPEEVNELSN